MNTAPTNPANDKIWLWCHPANSYENRYNLPGLSTIEPMDAARQLGLDKLLMVVFIGNPEPPFLEAAKPMADAEQLVWSIVGSGGTKRNDGASDLDDVCQLAKSCPNLTGAMMDDFFHGPDAGKEESARLSLAQTEHCRDILHNHGLDLWVVVYDHQLDQPLTPYLDLCDVATFWTWQAEDLVNLETNFARLEKLAPNTQKLLGCYMWDFGKEDQAREIPPDLMNKQLACADQWLADGRIDGVILLASCICDQPIAGVERCRQWLEERTP